MLLHRFLFSLSLQQPSTVTYGQERAYECRNRLFVAFLISAELNSPNHKKFNANSCHGATSAIKTALYSFSDVKSEKMMQKRGKVGSAHSVHGPSLSLWNSLPDSLRDPDLGRHSFVACWRCTYWHCTEEL